MRADQPSSASGPAPASSPHSHDDAQAAAVAGDQSAAAEPAIGSPLKEHGQVGPTETPSAADPIPDDATLIKNVNGWIAKRKFQSAADVASFIRDDDLRDATLQRIAAAYKKAATK